MMKREISLLTAACVASLMAGCGGGGGTTAATTTTTPVASTISGTVAAGAPLSGFVAVKDANGTVTTAAIDATGHYSIDVDTLTPPLVLFASGVAGGRAYTIASVATIDDVNGTVNVTPLTDLVVANVAGTDSTTFFNSPDPSLMTPSAISSAASLLKSRLQPLLDSAGIPADFDLVHSSFSADRSGMDGVLDVLDVSVNPDTDTATISYVLNGTVTISDNLADNADSSVIDTTGVDVSGDTTATQAIATAIANFNAQFANGLPATTAIAPFFDDTFMFNGIDKTGVLAYFTSTDAATQESASADRSAMQGFAIVALDTSASPQTATIRFGAYTMAMSNDGSGWKMLGNGDRWDAWVNSETHLYLSNNQVRSELNFSIVDNAGGELQSGDYFIVHGPGLPTVGVVMVQYDFNNFSNANSTANMIYGYTVNDATVANIADGDSYTITRYRDLNGDTNVYAASPTPVTVGDASTLTGTGDDVVVDSTSRVLIKRPLLSSETASFAQVSAPSQADLGSFSSGTLNVSWTLPAGSRSVDVTFDRALSDGTYERAADNYVASTALSTTLDVPVPGTTVNSQAVIVFTNDVFGRTIATQQDVSSVTPPLVTGGAIVGAWRYVNGTEFRYLIAFNDGTYLYAENDPNATYATENGVEVGTYTYDQVTGALTLNVLYDDNTAPTDGAGSFSGSGSIGYPTAATVQQTADGSQIIIAAGGGSITLDAMAFGSAGSEVGVWTLTGGTGPGSFNYLVFFPDGNFLYAENDLTATTAEENGLEVGLYSYDSLNQLATFNILYDDNAPGAGSGIGDIGTPAVIDGVLSNGNNTLTVAGGALVLTRAF